MKHCPATEVNKCNASSQLFWLEYGKKLNKQPKSGLFVRVTAWLNMKCMGLK